MASRICTNTYPSLNEGIRCLVVKGVLALPRHLDVYSTGPLEQLPPVYNTMFEPHTTSHTDLRESGRERQRGVAG